MTEEKKPFDPTAYKNKFNAENYDRVNLILTKKGEKARLQAHAKSKGESLNAFINRAIYEQIVRDQTPVSDGTWEHLKSLYQAGKGTDQLSAEDEETLRAIIAKHLK